MAVGQRETCAAVIEDPRCPCRDRVARGALGGRRGESRCNVIGHVPANCCGAQENRLVAAITICRIQRVVVADMAGGAGRRRGGRVCSGQNESGRAMVPRCRGKTHCCVAIRAVRYSE